MAMESLLLSLPFCHYVLISLIRLRDTILVTKPHLFSRAQNTQPLRSSGKDFPAAWEFQVD